MDEHLHLDPGLVGPDQGRQVRVERDRGPKIDMLFLDNGVERRGNVTASQVKLRLLQGGLGRLLGRLGGGQLGLTQHQLAVFFGYHFTQQLVLLLGNGLVALFNFQILNGLGDIALSLPDKDFIISIVDRNELLSRLNKATRDDIGRDIDNLPRHLRTQRHLLGRHYCSHTRYRCRAVVFLNRDYLHQLGLSRRLLATGTGAGTNLVTIDCDRSGDDQRRQQNFNASSNKPAQHTVGPFLQVLFNTISCCHNGTYLSWITFPEFAAAPVMSLV